MPLPSILSTASVTPPEKELDQVISILNILHQLFFPSCAEVYKDMHSLGLAPLCHVYSFLPCVSQIYWPLSFLNTWHKYHPFLMPLSQSLVCFNSPLGYPSSCMSFWASSLNSPNISLYYIISKIFDWRRHCCLGNKYSEFYFLSWIWLSLQHTVI